MTVLLALLGDPSLIFLVVVILFSVGKVILGNTWYYLILSLLTLLILVLFIILAKHYKLQKRERHVNTQATAEEHYERYLDQEEEYMREVANMQIPTTYLMNDIH